MNKMGFGFLRVPTLDPQDRHSFDWAVMRDAVDAFISAGGNYFDTCYTYLDGFSETGLRDILVNRYPRDSYLLVDKLPGYKCTCYEDCEKYLQEQMERCGVEFFDIFMLHWLNQENYDIAEKYEEFRFLGEVKERGLAKKIGFSYHDSASLLDEILTRHPEIDVVQIQINYLDWDSAGLEARNLYEVCCKHGKPVVVMEPIKGGTLAKLPPEAEAVLRAVHPDWTPASWALRFVQGLPGVWVCLSGMNALFQVEENMAQVEPLNGEELAALEKVAEIINSKTAVPCTGCRYCEEHCPNNLAVPDIFRMLNEITRYPADGWKIKPTYQQLAKTRGIASDCVACRSCEEHCPQHIEISEFMKQAVEKLG